MKPVTIAMIVVASLIALIAILLVIINHSLSKVFNKRINPDSRFKFLSLKDYPSLKMESVYIDSTYQVKLHGGIFSYPNDKYKGVIIFYHGYLSGYINYLNLINYFAKAGFMVVAFDALGCYTSAGRSMKGLAAMDKDNKQIINFVKSRPDLKKYPLFTLGHSWGGHLALTSLIQDDLAIKKAVALSPFNSNVDVTFNTSKKLKVVAPLIYLLNLFKFGHESTHSVTSALKYTTAEVLIYCGGQDQIVKPWNSYKKYSKAIKDNNLDHVTLKYLANRKHFIYLSERGEDYFTKEIAFPRTAPINFEHLDYSVLNELDENVLEEIVNFLVK